MPIRISKDLPAFKILEDENIFVMSEDRAMHQDIRPLEIAILNLMPKKIITETQLLRLIGNTPLQVNVSLLQPETHKSKNTSKEHLSAFYTNFSEIKHRKFDGLIITGAPVEQLSFEEVNYWEELKEILDWSTTNVYSTLCICWAAQAALYHFHGIKKYPLVKKLVGVYPHLVLKSFVKLFKGFDDMFYAPHSRYTEVRKEDIINHKDLELLASSEEAGAFIVSYKKGKQLFVTGHVEYDAFTLKDEYLRDKKKGIKTEIPKNYFPNDDITQKPLVMWRSHANLLFSNWLNYYVYQETPYEL